MGQDDPKLELRIYAARYRAARAYAGKSRKQVALALGLSYETIKRRELAHGDEVPKPGERHELARFCGVPPEFIDYGWEAADYSGVGRLAVRGLGADAARGELSSEGQQDSPQVLDDQDSPEDPEVGAQ